MPAPPEMPKLRLLFVLVPFTLTVLSVVGAANEPLASESCAVTVPLFRPAPPTLNCKV